jgi:hypothetical protein
MCAPNMYVYKANTVCVTVFHFVFRHQSYFHMSKHGSLERQIQVHACPHAYRGAGYMRMRDANIVCMLACRG